MSEKLPPLLRIYAQKQPAKEDLKKLERSYEIALKADWQTTFPLLKTKGAEKGTTEERSLVLDLLVEAMGALTILHGVTVHRLQRCHPSPYCSHKSTPPALTRVE